MGGITYIFGQCGILLLLIFCVCFIQGSNLNSTDKEVLMNCDGSDIDDSKENLNSEVENFISYNIVNHEILVRCPPPETSYSTIVEKNAINASEIRKASIYLLKDSMDKDLKALHLQGLSLYSLMLVYDQTISNYEFYDMGSPDLDFLEPLTELFEVTVINAKFPPMQDNSKVQYVELLDGLSTGSFGGCKKVRKIHFSRWNAEEYLDLAQCQNLKILYMYFMSADSVTRVVSGAISPEIVKINNCDLSVPIPKKIFESMLKLRYLDLSSNELQAINFNLSLPSLTTLLLTNNEIFSLESELPNTRLLSLNKNILFDLCDDLANKMYYPNLNTLMLTDTSTELQCVDSKMLPALRELYMEDYNYNLQLSSLTSWPVPLYINLDRNRIKDVTFTQTDYETLRKSKPNITISGNIELDCDCQHPYFAKALRQNLFKFFNSSPVICKDMDRISLQHTMWNQTECNKTECGECVCRRWSNGETTADCRGLAVTGIPRVEGLTALLAPDNRLQLTEEDIPDTLTYLDLTQTHHHIMSINESIARKLFSIKNRTILLAGNSFLCDCVNKKVIEIMLTNLEQVIGKDYLTCEGKDERKMLLRDVNIQNLCIDNIDLIASLVASGALLVLIIITIIVNYQYGQDIRVFLYARGWCLYCVTEDDDIDRFYDAFVSFSHEDEILVANELVPQLEKLGYKICVHYRDWVLGDMIPNQIVRSVENSRRTIIILSKHFVYSLWGSLEFKTAHSRALKDGVARVILIVTDDVIESEDLDGDLRSYTRTNTYVTWGDPWFWDKLKYALRRRRGWRGHGEAKNTTTGTPNIDINLAELPNMLPAPQVPIT